MSCWARRSISSPWSVLCHPECNEGSQGMYCRPPPRRPRDSSLRSEWQHRTSLLITNCSLLFIWDCHGLFQASQWRDLYNTCHTLSHLSHYPHPLWQRDIVTMWQPRQRNIREHHDPISCQSGANLPPIKMLRWMGHTRGISHSVQRLRWWRSATITRKESHATIRLYGNR